MFSPVHPFHAGIPVSVLSVADTRWSDVEAIYECVLFCSELPHVAREIAHSSEMMRGWISAEILCPCGPKLVNGRSKCGDCSLVTTARTPSFSSHSPTPTHTCKRPPLLFFPKPRQLRYLGKAASLTASAVGDRSLMWVCHITRTPGCSTSSSCPSTLHTGQVIARIAEVTICIISERLLDRPRQLPLHSLAAEAEGGNRCCSRTSAPPHRGHPGRRRKMACQPCPR